MRIAITGAGGFIGRRVVAQALALGHEVVAVGRSAAGLDSLPSGGAIRHCSLDLREAGDDAFAALGKPDLCLHLAWGALANFNAPEHYELELPAHFEFLKRLVAGGLGRLVVAGTCLEYGLQSGCLAEDLPTRPTTSYGHAKDALRRQLEFLRRDTGFALGWGRIFYLHGDAPGRRTLYMQLKAAVERGEKRFPMSRGEQLRDYLPVETVASHLLGLGFVEGGAGVVNICSGEPISVRRLVEGWIAENGWDIAPDLGRYPYPDYEPLAYWGSAVRLKSVLGLA